MPIVRSFLALSAAVILLVLGANLAVAGVGAVSAAAQDGPTIITLGKVTTVPAQTRRMLGPLAAHVARYLQDLGIKGIRLLFAKNNKEMLQYLRAGRVDWITETASGASAFVDAQGAEILARRWRRGAPEFQTIIVARRESDILGIKDLSGKTLALETPDSVPGYFIPANAILQAGLTLDPIDSVDKHAAKGSVRYLFSRDKLVTSAWVHEGKVDAGVFSDRDWRSDEIISPAYRADFRIIYTSAKFPYALELVRAALPAVIKNRIRAALLEAHETRTGRAALRAYNRSARFDDAPARVTRSIAELRDIRNTVQSRLP